MPTQGTMVQFKAGLYENYVAIATKDLNTIYFCTDTQQMFIGETEYTRPVITGSSLPEIDSPLNTLFYHTTEKALYSNIGGTWTKVSNEYVHPNSGTTAGTYGQVTVNAQGHVTAGTTATDVAHGGTGKTSVTANSLLKGNGTSAMAEIAPGTTGQVLKMTADGPAWGTDNNTTYSDMKGATASAAGTHGLVPAPAAGKQTSFLRGDGTWVVPTNTNTTYTFAEGTTNGAFDVTPSGGSKQSVPIHGLGSAAYTESSAYATAAQGTLATNAMPKSGGTFTGLVTLSGAPTNNLHAATKAYVDSTVSSAVSSVFKFKGTVATVNDLPSSATEGDVYHVTAKHGEYIYAKVDGATTATWESLGEIVDLSAYALSADVIQRVTGATGMVPKLTADGTLVSSGFTLGVSVPANAKFTDTVYTHPAGSAASKTSGLYKFSTDSTSHISAVTAVTKTDITALGIPAQDTTYSVFTGATADAAGTSGLVVAPAKGDQAKFLKADGTWATPANTTYSGDRGISLVSGKFGHSNPTITANTSGLNTAKTLAWGSAITLNTIKYDIYGHITGTGTYTITMPANPNTDTHHQAKNIVGASATATANAATTNTTTFLNLVENGAVRSSHQIKGSGATTVTATSAGVITVSSTDTKLTWGSF